MERKKVVAFLHERKPGAGHRKYECFVGPRIVPRSALDGECYLHCVRFSDRIEKGADGLDIRTMGFSGPHRVIANALHVI